MRIFLLVLLFFSGLHAEPHPLLDYFHVVTVATRHHPNIDKLIQSCQMHGMELEILGMGNEYPGNGAKFIYMRDYIQNLKDYEIVMFVDAFDVLIVADKEVILDKFLQMEQPFVMSVEKNCYPCDRYEGFYPPSPTHFKYLNTGSYIGYVAHLKRWFKALEPIIPHVCDQAQAVSHYVKNPKLYFFDFQCELFLPLYNVKPNEVIINYKDKLVYSIPTRSNPCVIHANGWSFDFWHKVYEQLVRNETRKN